MQACRTCLWTCLLTILCLLTSTNINGQGHEWWSNNVQWDGITHWSEYIISSPRFLGPNALPIPSQNKGLLQEEHRMGLSGNYHTAPGDQTYNLSLYLDYVLVPEKISFDLYWVPLEYFEMSHELKTERNVFHIFYDSKRATGDILLNTNIQLLRQTDHFANATLRIGYRFASSDKQGAARFTDAPGYYFDLGLGKQWQYDNLQITGSIMLGFKVWQTNRDDQFQNDAFLFGLGMLLDYQQWQLDSSFRGFAGYLNNGDRPMVLENRLHYRIGRWQPFLNYSYGFRDNLYQRIEMGIHYWIPISAD